MDPRVLSRMTEYMERCFANPHSADHALGWQAQKAVVDAAAGVAGLIGADADEVVFTSGATESNNLALLGLARRAVAGKRRRILVSEIEHKCVLAIGRNLAEHHGYAVELLPVDSAGRVDLANLEEQLDENVLLVSIMAVNNEIGTIQDIQAIASIAHKYGSYFHSDAAQAPCSMDLRDIATYCDLLSLSGHKIYGPKGIGALYVRRDLHAELEPLVYGGGQQHGLRSGTVPLPLCAGMSIAAELLTGNAAYEERSLLRERRDKLLQALLDLPWEISLNGPERRLRHPGNANVRFAEFSAHDILGALQPRIAASTGAACTSGIPEPSHVLRAIGLTETESSIRFSIGRGTTDSDIDEAVEIIAETLSRLARAGLAHSGATTLS